MTAKKNILNIIILFCLFLQIFSASSIAIDFGSEFITTSILLPRKPINLVENPQGTKINQYLYMKGNEKIFGINAKVKAIKSPESVFHHMQEFLGKTEDSPEVKNYLKNYFQAYDISTDEQHQALLNAAEISGMKLIHLLHDNAAVAIKYFNENRIQKEEKFYIFYNMGASYTQVTLVSVRATYQGTKKDMTENQYIKIVDEAYDKNLGGRNFDYKLAKLIYKKYKKKVYNIVNIKKFYQLIKIL